MDYLACPFHPSEIGITKDHMVIHFRIYYQETPCNILHVLIETYCHLLLIFWKNQQHVSKPKVLFSIFSKKTTWFKPSSPFLNFLKKDIMALCNQVASPKIKQCEYQVDNKDYKDNQVQIVHIWFNNIFHNVIVIYWQIL